MVTVVCICKTLTDVADVVSRWQSGGVVIVRSRGLEVERQGPPVVAPMRLGRWPMTAGRQGGQAGMQRGQPTARRSCFLCPGAEWSQAQAKPSVAGQERG